MHVPWYPLLYRKSCQEFVLALYVDGRVYALAHAEHFPPSLHGWIPETKSHAAASLHPSDAGIAIDL